MPPPASPPLPRVLVVGCGLIGGSIAGQLRRTGSAVTVCDRASVARTAVRRGLADDGCSLRQLRPVLRAKSWDVVVLAMPISAILATLPRMAIDLQALPTTARPVVIDTGSVKAPIMAAAASCNCPRFVGGHPMAGREQGGLDHATPELFFDRTFVLCPPPRTNPKTRARARAFVRQLGARAKIMTPEAHDRAVALVSHLPHWIAQSLMETARLRSDRVGDLPWSVAAGAWRDATRVAAADAAIWDGIFTHNRHALIATLREWTQVLETMEAQILGLPGGRKRPPRGAVVDIAKLAHLRRKLAASLPSK